MAQSYRIYFVLINDFIQFFNIDFFVMYGIKMHAVSDIQVFTALIKIHSKLDY